MKNKIEKRIAELEIMEMQSLTTLASIRGAIKRERRWGNGIF
jgi:hypothetical protein